MDAATLPFLTAQDTLTVPPTGWRLIDVRKPQAAQADGRTLKTAQYIDPFDLSFAHPILTNTPGLIFFCVHGHEVSQFATALSLVAGTPARYVQGGYEALCAAGAVLVELSEGPQ